jgi:hypothetical protein
MLLFLATIVEQLDLALEHVTKRDVHNARFGLMLTDNAVELFLHQLAKEKRGYMGNYKHLRDKYPHHAALDKALGRSFDAKVRFAKLDGNLSEEVARTINIMHEYRNEIYHVGLQHESILPNLALFYLEAICGYLKDYEPRGIGWGSNQKLPERAKKYFKKSFSMPGGREDFAIACAEIAKACGHDAGETIGILADHMDEVISNQDDCLDVVAAGVYEGQRTTRDEAVVGCQTWPLAFSGEGEAFAAKHGWSGSKFSLIEWLAANYPIKYKHDPIAAWERQAAKLRAQNNPHAALAHHQSFMTETATLRDAIYDSAAAAEAEIESAMDRMRGK